MLPYIAYMDPMGFKKPQFNTEKQQKTINFSASSHLGHQLPSEAGGRGGLDESEQDV